MVYALFRIIPRVGENPRIKSALNAVTTGNDNSVDPSVNEIVIQQNLPLGMVKFTLAECHKRPAGRMAGRLFGSKFLETTREL